MRGIHTFALLIACVLSADAHRITVDALYDDGVVYLECWLGSGDPAAGGKLTVTDATGDTIHTAVLDAEGYTEFRPSAAVSLTFTVDAGAGHKGMATLDLTGIDLQPIAGAAQITPPPSTTTPASGQSMSRRPSLRSSHGGLTDGERVVLGIICLASLAAAYLGYRNQKRIAAIEDKLRARDLDSR